MTRFIGYCDFLSRKAVDLRLIAPVGKSGVAAHRQSTRRDAYHAENNPKNNRRRPAEFFGHRAEAVGRYRAAYICAAVEYSADRRCAPEFRKVHRYERHKQMVHGGYYCSKQRQEYHANGDRIFANKDYARQRYQRHGEAERRRCGLVVPEHLLVKLRSYPRAAEIDYRHNSRQQQRKRGGDVIFFGNKRGHPRADSILQHTLDEHADAYDRRAGNHKELAERDFFTGILMDWKRRLLPFPEDFRGLFRAYAPKDQHAGYYSGGDIKRKMPRREFYRRRRYHIGEQAAYRERRRYVQTRTAALLLRQDGGYYIEHGRPEHGLNYSVESPDNAHGDIARRAQRHYNIGAHRPGEPRAYHFIGRHAVAEYSAEYLTRSVTEEIDRADKSGMGL